MSSGTSDSQVRIPYSTSTSDIERGPTYINAPEDSIPGKIPAY